MSKSNWIIPFTIVDSLNRMFYGMYPTLLGPSLPFLANAVNVDIETINWLQPFASVAGLLGAVIAAMTFKKYFVTSRQKLSYLIVMTILMTFTAVLPVYTSTFWVLIVGISFRSFIGQMLELPCQGIYVYTLGPEASQAFIMLFHCTVGMGFLLGPVLIRPFFPEQSLQEREELCWHNSSSPDDLDNFKIENFTVIDDIKWPYWIMSLGHCLCAFGYLIVMFLPYEMPVFNNTSQKKETRNPFENFIKDMNIQTYLSIITFYAASCGSERLFQSLEFTFGFCGPLKLTSQESVVTDDAYNGGFVIGRLASILTVKYLKPKLMLKISLILCFIATILLSLESDQSSTLLYVCAAIFGFAVSWQFASTFSWIALHMDLVGPKAALISIGCSLSFIAPLTGAYLFALIPMALWHFNLLLVLIQILSYWLLHRSFKSVTKEDYKEVYKYKELQQQFSMEEIDLSTSDEEIN